MALNFTGPISIGGPTTGQSINLEVGKASTASTTLNDTDVRSLAQQPVTQSVIVMPTDFWGKAYNLAYYYANDIWSYTNINPSMSAGIAVNRNNNNTYFISLGTVVGGLSGQTIILQVFYPDGNGIVLGQYVSGSTTLGITDTSLEMPSSTSCYVDTYGNVFVAVYAVNNSGLSTTCYPRITKFDANLTKVWETTLNVNTDPILGLTNIVEGPSQELYFASTQLYNSGGYTTYYAAIHYIANTGFSGSGIGVITAGKTSEGTGTFGVMPTALAYDSYHQYLVLGGTTYFGGSTYPFTIIINASGGLSVLPNTYTTFYDPLWYGWFGTVNQIVTYFDGSSSYAYVAVEGNDASSYASSFLVKLNLSNQTVVWQKKIVHNIDTHPLKSIAVDSNYDVYAVGNFLFTLGVNSVPTVVKFYSDDGYVIFQNAFTAAGAPGPGTNINTGIVINSKDTMCITSTLYSFPNVIKLPADGSKLGSYNIYVNPPPASPLQTFTYSTAPPGMNFVAGNASISTSSGAVAQIGNNPTAIGSTQTFNFPVVSIVQANIP